MPRDKIVFQTNIPVELALESPGAFVQGNFGDQYQYFTTDDRIFWAPPVVEHQMVQLEVQPGELIVIVKSQVKEGRRSVTRWIVNRVEGSGTLAVPKVGQEVKGSSPSPAPPHTAIPQPKDSPSPTAQPSDTITTRRERWIDLLTDAIEAVKETSARTGRMFDGTEFQDIISTLLIDQQKRDEMDLRYLRAVPSTRAHVPQTNGHNGAIPWHQ